MIGGILGLASYGLGTGGDIGNFLFRLEQMGVFAYLLPFLLIFAITYGVLSNVKLLGDNQAINAVLAIAIGLMSLQFNFVAIFFSEIFPRLGIGLSILLVVIILLGSFMDFSKDDNKWMKWVFGILGGIIALFVIFQSLGSSFLFGGGLGFNNFNFLVGQSGPLIVIIVLTVGTVLGVIFSNKKKKEEKE